MHLKTLFLAFVGRLAPCHSMLAVFLMLGLPTDSGIASGLVGG